MTEQQKLTVTTLASSLVVVAVGEGKFKAADESTVHTFDLIPAFADVKRGDTLTVTDGALVPPVAVAKAKTKTEKRNPGREDLVNVA